jgi:hypothetical protein
MIFNIAFLKPLLITNTMDKINDFKINFIISQIIQLAETIKLNQGFLVFPTLNILTDESPPAIATCSLSGEKSAAKTPRVSPVTVP